MATPLSFSARLEQKQLSLYVFFKLIIIFIVHNEEVFRHGSTELCRTNFDIWKKYDHVCPALHELDTLLQYNNII